MKSQIGSLMKALFLNGKEILLFELLFRICQIIVLGNAGGFLLTFALRFRSYSYLTAHNLTDFLLSPVTVLCLILFLFLLFLATLFESCVLTTAFQASVGGTHIGFLALIGASLRRGRAAFRLRRLNAALPLLSFSFVSNLYFTYHIFYRLNPFCTFLPMFFEYPAAVLGTAATVIVLAVYSFTHLFSFCYLLLGRDEGKEIKRKSRLIFLYHPGVILCCFLGICVGMGVLWHLLRSACSLIAGLAAFFFADADIRLALILTMNQYITLITLWICVIAGSVIHQGAITCLFYHYSEYEAGDPPITSAAALSPGLRRLLVPSIILLTGSMALYIYLNLYNVTVQAERAMPFIHIAAHRGVSSEAPENTLPAIELAIDDLADSVEIDVQATADGEIVVYHDSTLQRLNGTSKPIDEVTLGELRTLDAGVLLPGKNMSASIPTLSEVLDVVKDRINLIIELKRNRAGSDLAQKVVALIEEYDMELQCVIQSPDLAYLREVKELKPELAAGYILPTAIGNFYDTEYIDFFCVRSVFITGSTVRGCHEAGKEIFAWTVNSRDELERMKRIQVDTIITDYPIRAREILYRENNDVSLLRLLRLLIG